MEIQNAKIGDTMLGFEGHGILTISIGLDYGEGVCQSFGGYSLGGQTKVSADTGKYLHQWVCGLLRVVGVESWEDLRGQHIRVEKESEYGKVVRIGHFLKDEWFDPKSI